MSIIKFYPVSGAMSDISTPCYILQIDDWKFLLDSGWDEKFDAEVATELKKYVHKIDCVLLSHSDTYHLGALPFLVGKCGLKCPIYATIPVFKMGQMFMYDQFLNRSNVEDFDLFNLDDIDSAFESIVQLEYSHPVHLKGRGLGISITALPAGHTLGGTIWKISKTGEQDIFYAIDHNNKKERHLNGLVEMEGMPRPGIFITNALNALYVQEKRRKRDDMLLGKMQQTLRAGGNVLVATDTAGRALELILMIDQMWKMKDSGLAPYSLIFLNNVAYNVVEFAKSQVEWMSEKLIKAFETQKTNPFQLKNVKLCHTLIELSQIGTPKVVVTSSADLECGFARDLFLQWCQDPLSCVILTSRTSPGTLGRILLDGVPRGYKIDLQVKHRVKLEGKELEEYLQKKQTDKKKKIEVMTIDDSEDEEPQVLFSFANAHNQKRNHAIRHDLNLIHQRSSEDESNVFKTNNNNHSLDNPPKKRRFDDYGEVIRSEDFKENGQLKKDKSVRKSTLSSSSDLTGDNEPPTKSVSSVQTFSVNCQINFIDFEGRSDIEATLKMLQEIKPHHLVIVRGSPQSSIAMDALVRKLLPNTKISKPSLRRVANLSSGFSQVLQVRLTDSLMSSLQLQKVKDSEIAWIDGQLEENDSSQDELQSGLMLQPLSKDEVPSHTPLVVSRVRISELRQILAKNNIQCELVSGTLKCTCSNGVVFIRKDPETKSVHIECNGLPEEFYTIRSLLYDQLAML